MHWFGKYLSLALTLPASVAAGYLLATIVNRWLHRSYLPAVGILVGMAAGLVEIFRQLMRDEKKQ